MLNNHNKVEVSFKSADFFNLIINKFELRNDFGCWKKKLIDVRERGHNKEDIT